MSALSIAAVPANLPVSTRPRRAEDGGPYRSATAAPLFTVAPRTVKDRPGVAVAEQAFFWLLFSGVLFLLGSFAALFVMG